MMSSKQSPAASGVQAGTARDGRFPRPSDLFRWCLENATHRSGPMAYREVFPQYHINHEADGYLWRQYDRRLSDLIAAMRPGLRVLEVGCGFGHDLCWTAIHGAKATGIDVKSDMVSMSTQLKKRLETEFGYELDVEIVGANLLDFDRDGSFDFIYMKDTLHHLEPRQEIVPKLAALLAPGGRLLIVEPNAWNPMIQYKMFRIRGFKTIIELTDAETGKHFIYGNERLLTGGTMTRLFAAAGLKGSTHSFRLIPSSLSTNRRLTALADRIEAANIERLLPLAPIHTVYCGIKTP